MLEFKMHTNLVFADTFKEFVENERKAGKDIEVDLAVEILSHREILI